MSSIPRNSRLTFPLRYLIAKYFKIAAEATQAPANVSNPLRASLIDAAPAAFDSACVMYREYPIYFGSTPADFWVCIPGCPTEYGTLSELVCSIDIYLAYMPC
jgi:hypothetical protein